MSSSTPEERFAALVEEMLSSPGVTPPSEGKRFGSAGLKIQDKIFAMLSGGRLVVKLPKARVDALVASGNGECFDPRKNGRPMKEWFVVGPVSDLDWLALAREAMLFVGAKGQI